MKLALLLAVSMLACGCASVGSVAKEPPTQGTPQTFQATEDATIASLRDAIRDVGLTIKRDEPAGAGHMIIADRGVRAESFGEVVRATIQPGKDGTTVWVLTRAAFAGNGSAKTDYAQEIFARMSRRIAPIYATEQ